MHTRARTPSEREVDDDAIASLCASRSPLEAAESEIKMKEDSLLHLACRHACWVDVGLIHQLNEIIVEYYARQHTAHRSPHGKAEGLRTCTVTRIHR
jgi:hypothetical protein